MGDIFRVGNSRPLVRGFFASIFRSTNRLKPMAALRAETIATNIHTNSLITGVAELAASPNSIPQSAKGNANKVCENLMKEK